MVCLDAGAITNQTLLLGLNLSLPNMGSLSFPFLCTFRCLQMLIRCMQMIKKRERYFKYLYIEREKATNGLVISMLCLSGKQSLASGPCLRCLFDLDLLKMQLVWEKILQLAKT